MNGADVQQMEEMKRQALGKILTKEAYERLCRVRIANPALAGQAELYLMQLFQAGKLSDRLGDQKLREILTVLAEKKEMKIRRK